MAQQTGNNTQLLVKTSNGQAKTTRKDANQKSPVKTSDGETQTATRATNSVVPVKTSETVPAHKDPAVKVKETKVDSAQKPGRVN